MRFLRGRNDEIIHRFYNEQCVLVSESFARRFRLAEGETLRLPSPEGVESFPIAGVFYDYTSDQGTVFLSEKNFLKFWHDDRVNSLGLYLKKGADPETVAEAFRGRFSKSGEFSIYSNRLLRSRIFEIFDQTFAVTYVLRTIAVLVAIVGIFLGLTTLVTERSRELGVMRSIGASAAQIRRLLLWESGMIGLLASCAWAGFWTLPVTYPDRRDQSRFFWMDDSARFPVVVTGLDSDLDRRSGGRGRMDSGVAGGTNQCRGGGSERMRGIAGFRIRMADWIAVLAMGCVAADWQIATPGWRYDFPRDHHAHDAIQNRVVVFHRKPDEQSWPTFRL